MSDPANAGQPLAGAMAERADRTRSGRPVSDACLGRVGTGARNRFAPAIDPAFWRGLENTQSAKSPTAPDRLGIRRFESWAATLARGCRRGSVIYAG